MTCRNTIIITLQWYFNAKENEISRFDDVCDVLLFGLLDRNYEDELADQDLRTEIQVLARGFAPNDQSKRVTIEKDLCKLLTNWWDTSISARQELRIYMEKEDLFADLVEHIKDDIMDDPQTRPYYNRNILQALIQMSTSPTSTIDPYLKQRLPKNVDINKAYQYYKDYSSNHGFGKDYQILLELLFAKMTRNEDRHAYFTVQEYKQYCRKERKIRSYKGYISYRGLNIPSEFSSHCERLFQQKNWL